MIQVPATSVNGWILIHQLVSTSSITFQRPWVDYKLGFGDPTGNYWFGNEKVHQLTSMENWMLRVEVEGSFNRLWYSSEYFPFVLSSEATMYTMFVDGYVGDGGDGFRGGSLSDYICSGRGFTTSDVDHDSWSGGNCAASYGGWWWGHCATALLIGPGSNSRWEPLKLMGYTSSLANVRDSRMMIKRY